MVTNAVLSPRRNWSVITAFLASPARILLNCSTECSSVCCPLCTIVTRMSPLRTSAFESARTSVTTRPFVMLRPFFCSAESSPTTMPKRFAGASACGLVRPAGPVEAERGRVVARHFLDHDADTTARYAAFLAQLLLDIERDVDRDGERQAH